VLEGREGGGTQEGFVNKQGDVNSGSRSEAVLTSYLLVNTQNKEFLRSS
jgi:hypothetical protein